MSKTANYLWKDFFSSKNETEITILSTLKSNHLFAKLSPRELKWVAQMVHMRVYEPGEAIFKQYEKGLGMYMIAKGNVDIKVRPNDKSDEEILVTKLDPGSFLGELALIDDNRRTASAYSSGPSTLVGFFKPDLTQIMERKPEMGVKILFQLTKVLGRRLNETTDALSQMSKELDEMKNPGAKKAA